MKKVIASLVSISIVALSSIPAPAQGASALVRGAKAITKSPVSIVTKGGVRLPSNIEAINPAIKALNSLPAQNGALSVNTYTGQIEAAELAEQQAAISKKIEQLAKGQDPLQNLSYAQIAKLVDAGNTSGLSDLILKYPNENVRQGMLRNEFLQVALKGNSSVGQVAEAADFWRKDLTSSLNSFSSIPEGNLKALVAAYKQKNASLVDVNEMLADVAALGLYGTKADAAAILDFYQKAAPTVFEPLAAAASARAILNLGAKTELAQLTELAGSETPFWKSIVKAAQEQGITLKLPSKQAAQPEVAEFLPALGVFGKVNRLAADPDPKATELYIKLGNVAKKSIQPENVLGNQQPLQPIATADLKLAVPEINIPSLADNLNPTALQLKELSFPTTPETTVSGEMIPTAGTAVAAAANLTALQRAAQQVNKVKNPSAATAVSGKPASRASISFFSRNAKPAVSDNSGTLYGGIPVPAIWQGAKKAFSSIKKMFASKPAAAQLPELIPGQAKPSNLKAAFQRASLYMASFVMGLEVATPVIANFGTSFGLSLSDNILVAVATYLPYSVGAFFSNWLKQKIGRKASMNLGLALMGTGFTAGVTLFGLNGNFIPWENTMAHFYNILACITIASTGGVFVHNAVGPMMTALSAGEEEIVAQKRTSFTELSRALGMAASFAFPYFVTKGLDMDWSFTFAMPIPLVALAALGINVARIPNTKPVIEEKLAAPPMPVTIAQRNRRAYQLTSSILNNSYVRLLKEEKGVLPLLAGLLTMNAVEMAYNNGFLFLLEDLMQNSPSKYLFGLVQFAFPFLIGRYLASGFLKWFPKSNMTVATLISALGGMAAVPFADNVYALTAALFTAEVGVSTAFTLAFARSARNIRTQDRIVSLIVASAISCAFGPMLLTNLAEKLMSFGMFASDATTYAMIGVSAVLSLFSAALFARSDRAAQAASDIGQDLVKNQKPNWFKRMMNRFLGK